MNINIEKSFPLKNLNLYLKENEVEDNCDLVSLHNIFINMKIFDKNKSEETIKNLEKFKVKLFNFLYDIAMDQILLGNEFIYLTDYDIYWDKRKERFGYSSMELYIKNKLN